ncbi:MAG: hypothetical protein II625_06255 [Bacilli bacterium]|nr:hypothetical protein [Bacilli bacterium]
MNKDQRINEILQYWAQLYRENPTKEFSDRTFYNHLIFTGVKMEDRRINLSIQQSKTNPNFRKNPAAIDPNCNPQSTFNNWIQLYSDSRKTDCFVSPYWQYFCQFVSKDNKARMSHEHIKIYIPLDSDHIEYGAKMIFDFLEQNNISHLSKIGREIRFDDIVVRLINPDDAKKLLDFVSRNPYLQEGLIQANPFAFQKNGIAMAVDGSESYNSTVATLIKAYMDYRRKTNTLNNVNVENFYEYIRRLYIDQFISRRNQNLKTILDWKDKDEEKNYQEIVSLIIRVHDPNFTYDDYMQHYATCANISYLTERQILETNRLLIEALEAMTIRFNRNGISNVNAFFDTGDGKYITSKNNLRERMLHSNFRTTLKQILHQKRMTFAEYAQLILDQYHIDLNSLIQKKTM